MFQNDSRRVTSQLALIPGPTFTALTDDPDRDFFRFGGGVTAAMDNGLAAFISYETTAGHSFMDAWGVNAAVVFEY